MATYGAPWGQKTANMARREESNEMNDVMGQKTLLFVAFFRMYDEEDAEPRVRSPCLGEPLEPLDTIQRGTAQIVDPTFVPVHILDGPVPLEGGALVVGVGFPAPTLWSSHSTS